MNAFTTGCRRRGWLWRFQAVASEYQTPLWRHLVGRQWGNCDEAVLFGGQPLATGGGSFEGGGSSGRGM